LNRAEQIYIQNLIERVYASIFFKYQTMVARVEFKTLNKLRNNKGLKPLGLTLMCRAIIQKSASTSAT